ncbi:MAG: hypothetical protein ACOYK9_00725 [Chlamydiia bacterium]
MQATDSQYRLSSLNPLQPYIPAAVTPLATIAIANIAVRLLHSSSPLTLLAAPILFSGACLNENHVSRSLENTRIIAKTTISTLVGLILNRVGIPFLPTLGVSLILWSKMGNDSLNTKYMNGNNSFDPSFSRLIGPYRNSSDPSSSYRHMPENSSMRLSSFGAPLPGQPGGFAQSIPTRHMPENSSIGPASFGAPLPGQPGGFAQSIPTRHMPDNGSMGPASFEAPLPGQPTVNQFGSFASGLSTLVSAMSEQHRAGSNSFSIAPGSSGSRPEFGATRHNVGDDRLPGLSRQSSSSAPALTGMRHVVGDDRLPGLSRQSSSSAPALTGMRHVVGDDRLPGAPQ